MNTFLLAVSAALLVAPTAPSEPHFLPDFGKDPTVNLSAIRRIMCDEGTGTGSLIRDGIVLTALHVATATHCYDLASGKPLSLYYSDPDHDIALMQLDVHEGPYIKYDCGRYVTGKTYASYGYSPYLQTHSIFRQAAMKAYGDYSGLSYSVNGKAYPHMRHLFGPSVFGHSGGPVIDPDTGMMKGMNNSGNTMFGLMTGHSFSTELADTVLCKA